MKYDIVNMSDPYTLESDSILAAAAACILLGRGQYMLRPLGIGEEVPFFMFGGLDEWWESHSPGVALGAWLDANKTAVAEVLDTVRMPGGHRRSSLNDIGGRAVALAKNLRAGSVSGPPPPQQVFTSPT